MGVWPQFAEAVFILGARLDGIGAGDLTKAAYGAADFFAGAAQDTVPASARVVAAIAAMASAASAYFAPLSSLANVP